MQTALCACLALVMLVTTACGSNDDEDSAAEKCDRLVGKLCDRAVECVPEWGTRQDCVESAKVNLACGKAVAVDQSYDDCIADLGAFSCGTLFPASQEVQWPANCEAVILF